MCQGVQLPSNTCSESTVHTAHECRSEHPNQARCEAVQSVSLWVRLSCRQAYQLKCTRFAGVFQMLFNTQEQMLEFNYRSVGFCVEDVLFFYFLLPVEETVLISSNPLLLLSSPLLSSHLWTDVEVTVDGQNWVVPVLHGFWEEPMAATLEEPLEQEVGRSIQEYLFTVWGTDVLGRTDPSRVFDFLQRGESTSSNEML